MVEESDLEAVALTRSQSIDIDRFVDLDQVDPIYFDRAYYLSPADSDAQRRRTCSSCGRCRRRTSPRSASSSSGARRTSASSGR